MIYRYAATDPRRNPQHYMYAPFEGRDFIHAYMDSRRTWLDRLPESSIEPEAAVACIPTNLNTVVTTEVLHACAIMEASGQAAPSQWAGMFLRKVEVTRRLRAAYNIEGKAASEDDALLDGYAYAAFIFAQALGRSTQSRERLKWLNALIKTIDILASKKEGTLSPFAAYCAKTAGENEMAAVMAEARRMGVTLS